MELTTIIRLVAAALAVFVFSIIIYRRSRNAA
jgi:hypothetical protein